MTRYRLLSLASIASTILCVGVAAVAVHRWLHYLPEAERMWQCQRVVDAAVEHNHLFVDEGASDYRQLDRERSQFFVHEMEAAYDAEHWLYVALPRRIVLGLALLPAIWFLATCRRLHARSPASFPLKVVQLWTHYAITLLTLISLLTAIGIAGGWARAYFAPTAFVYRWLADERRNTEVLAVGLSVDRNAMVWSGSVAGPKQWIDERASKDMTAYERSMSQVWIPVYGLTHETDATFGPTVGYDRHVMLGTSWWFDSHLATPVEPTWYKQLAITVDYWLLETIFLLPPVIWFTVLYRRRRNKLGHCRKCGYDLTGNVSGVCPECGAKLSHARSQVPSNAPELRMR